VRAIARSLRRDSRQRDNTGASLRTHQVEDSRGESHREGTTRPKRKVGDSRMSNYQNRRKRGQCAGCTNQAMPDAVRCQACQSKNLERQRSNREAINARRRERAFQRSLERERRLDEIDARLKREIAELEKALA
jgi:hypothetical protein